MCIFFAAATLNGWDLSSVSMDDVRKDKDMGNFPDFILKSFLSKYDKVPEEGEDAAMRLPEGQMCLDIHRMALFRADELLGALPTSSRLTVEEFLMGWGSMLPPVRRFPSFESHNLSLGAYSCHILCLLTLLIC